MNKTNNQTTKATETTNKLTELMAERNKIIKWLEYSAEELASCGEFESINAEIVQTLSEMACYKTLKFLMANNANKGQNAEQTENGVVNTYGYNMALKLFNSLYGDIAIMHNTESIDTFTDAADLIQESNAALLPYFCRNVVFELEDTIFTKQLKNGNVKNYNAFQLACKSIRSYITEQDKKQYKKLAYSLGYTDNGKEILTTKRPKNEIDHIEQDQRKNFVARYNLTSIEQKAILNHLNGTNTTESAESLQVSKRTIERALKSAREKILKADKRVKL